jgi:uncharacterized membrane protein YdfJ with MMPL/SSD domain
VASTIGATCMAAMKSAEETASMTGAVGIASTAGTIVGGTVCSMWPATVLSQLVQVLPCNIWQIPPSVNTSLKSGFARSTFSFLYDSQLLLP